MNFNLLEQEFKKLGNYKTKDIDTLNKKLIKDNIDVSYLKDIIDKEDKYHRTYFQVSLSYLKTVEEKMKFIEENAYLLNDWWHVDQLPQFLKNLNLEYVYNKAKIYCNDNNPFLRRWGYVIFMPTLVKDERSFDMITSLLKNDEHYYVIMAEAWLISYLAIYFPEKTLKYLNDCNLSYDIVGKGIQKICDSFRIDDEYKEKFKLIRKKYK